MRGWRPVVAAVLIGSLIVGVVYAWQWRDRFQPEDHLQRIPTAAPIDDASETFRMAVIGDFGSGDDDERAIAASVEKWMTAEHANTLATTGDNVYPSGEPDEFDDAWRGPYGWVANKRVRVVASLGNHDVRTDGGQAVMRLLSMPGRWYSTRIGDAELFVLDANQPSNAKQASWLRTALGRSTASWKIAVFHQPAFSCSRHDSTPAVDRTLVPIFVAGGVDLVLNGHDHNYQRFARQGISYVVAGGSGRRLYDIDRCHKGEPPLVAGYDESHTFVTVEGSHLEALDAHGRRVDTLTLRHTAEGDR